MLFQMWKKHIQKKKEIFREKKIYTSKNEKNCKKKPEKKNKKKTLNRTFLWEKNFFFDGKPKMTKKIGFEISKPPKNRPKWRKNFWPKFFCNFFLILILSRFTNFYSILTLIPKFFCILLLFSKNFKNEVDQLHFVCFPWNFWWSIWRKLPIWRKWPFSEILVGNRQNEVVQLHFLKFWKVKEKCKKTSV